MNPATQKRLFLEYMLLAQPREIRVSKMKAIYLKVISRAFIKALGKMLLWAAWFSALTFVLCEMAGRGIWGE